MQNKNSKQNKTISAILSGVVLIALIFFLYSNKEAINSVTELHPKYILSVAVAHFAFIFVMGVLNTILVRRLDPEIPPNEIIFLQYINNLLNKIVPKGGPAFRAVYLKRRYNFPYSHFVTAFSGLVIIDIAAQSLIGLAGVYLIYLQTGLYFAPIIIGFAGLIMAAILIVMFRPNIPKQQNRILQVIKRVVEGWKIVIKHPTDILKYVLISILALFVKAFGMMLVFTGIASPIGLLEALLLSSLSSIFSYINITPDGLGAREAVYIFTTSVILLGEPIIVLGSLVERAITLLASTLYGGISYIILNKKEG